MVRNSAFKSRALDEIGMKLSGNTHTEERTKSKARRHTLELGDAS